MTEKKFEGKKKRKKKGNDTIKQSHTEEEMDCCPFDANL